MDSEINVEIGDTLRVINRYSTDNIFDCVLLPNKKENIGLSYEMHVFGYCPRRKSNTSTTPIYEIDVEKIKRTSMVLTERLYKEYEF